MLRYAAVDIGSNSTRLIAAEAPPGEQARVLLSERVVTRLGESVFRDGRISAQAMDEVVRVLARMADTYKKLEIAGVRAVATSAARHAAQQLEFLARASAALGTPVEIVSGRGEARLVP